MLKQDTNSALAVGTLEPETNSIELGFCGNQFHINPHEFELRGHHGFLESITTLFQKVVYFYFWARLDSKRSS